MIQLRARRICFTILLSLIASSLPVIAGAASSGPPAGKYACYNYGYNFQTFYNGVTLIIEDGSHYTTQGANFTGHYRYLQNGSIVFSSGKLRGLKSRFRQGHGGKAILIGFKNGHATNTAVCGLSH